MKQILIVVIIKFIYKKYQKIRIIIELKIEKIILDNTFYFKFYFMF